ncbi:MAG: YezD family protein [Deltaproteobacteria bacterium]|jgi:hypothetical protein|nr:YezD family protein [Deltaproteobacteria bacterium]
MIIVRHKSERKVAGGFPAASAAAAASDSHGPPILDSVMDLLRKTYHGQIAIVTQNHRVVQVERKENFDPEELSGLIPLALNEDGLNLPVVRKRITEALRGLEFGQVILVVKKGRLDRIERLLKERYATLQGVYGDGI